jgi:hypothetical protein
MAEDDLCSPSHDTTSLIEPWIFFPYVDEGVSHSQTGEAVAASGRWLDEVQALSLSSIIISDNSIANVSFCNRASPPLWRFTQALRSSPPRIAFPSHAILSRCHAHRPSLPRQTSALRPQISIAAGTTSVRRVVLKPGLFEQGPSLMVESCGGDWPGLLNDLRATAGRCTLALPILEPTSLPSACVTSAGSWLS